MADLSSGNFASAIKIWWSWFASRSTTFSRTLGALKLANVLLDVLDLKRTLMQ